MKSEGERLRAVISYFETILPSIKRSVQVRQKGRREWPRAFSKERWTSLLATEGKPKVTALAESHPESQEKTRLRMGRPPWRAGRV